MDDTIVKRPRNKIRNIMIPQGQKYLDALKTSTYKLNVGNAEPKKEYDLRREKKQRKIARDNMKQQKKVVRV